MSSNAITRADNSFKLLFLKRVYSILVRNITCSFININANVSYIDVFLFTLSFTNLLRID